MISFLFMGFLSVAVATDNKLATVNTPTTAPAAGTPASVAAIKTPANTANTVSTAATAATTATTATTASTATVAAAPENTEFDTITIEKITGIKGHLDKDTNSFKIIMPRNDLNIVVNGIKLSPAMGLTSWAVFKKTANTLTVKADLVVTENQVNTILSLALDNDLAVVALHNHLLWESPKVMFVHVEGVGDEAKLATAIKNVFSKTMDTNDEASDFPLASIDTTDTTLDGHKVDAVLGTKGAFKNGVYQVIISRFSQAKNEQGTKSPIINTAATFAGSDTEAVIDGDFAMRASDLHDVLAALHTAGIAVVALHQHESINPQTRVVYLHFFGVGKSVVLAKGVRKALDAAKSRDEAANKPSVALLGAPVLKMAPASVEANTAPVQEKKTQG